MFSFYCDSRCAQAKASPPSLADALIGVVVVAVVSIQLLSTANPVPHLFDPPALEAL